MKRKITAVLLVVALALALAVPAAPAAAAIPNADYDSHGGNITATGGTIAQCVAAPDDSKYVQLDDDAWIIMKFPGDYVAAPDGTTAVDLRIDIVDTIKRADAEILVSLDGSNYTSMGVHPDTANIDLDLDGIGAVKYVKVDQNDWYYDPLAPTLRFDLDAVVALNYGELSLEKGVSSNSANLGDHITVTLTVKNPYSWAIKVEDVIPADLKYIPGTFEVDAGSVVPTIVGNTISTTVSNGTHTVTFDVQVVEVQCEEVTVTNTARLLEGIEELDSDSEDITLWPYDGFEKTFTIVHEDNPNGFIEVNELVMWDMTITVPNNVGWDITDAVLKDNLGGELGMAGDGVDNDRDKSELADEDDGAAAWGDVIGAYNILHGYPITIKTPGKSNKVHFWISGIDIANGDPALEFMLGVFTDKNPSKHAHQCYTSTYVDHPLNSGATLKFTDPVTDFLLSAHTCPVLIDVVDPIPANTH